MGNAYDFLIVGGGIFGLTAAIELSKRKYLVGLLNPDTIPHHLAASTDISKAVRMEYGSDKEYMRMAEISIKRWKEWNELLGVNLYHEVGFLMLCKDSIDHSSQSFERDSYQNLMTVGYSPEKFEKSALEQRFPAVNSNVYKEAIFNPVGGFVESGLAVEHLAKYAESLGVDIHLGQTAERLVKHQGAVSGVQTREGMVFNSSHTHIASGAFTPLLVKELKPYLKATGHPVFWLKPKDPQSLISPNLAVFTADISNSGWYGFPLHEKQGVVKVAKHSNGKELHPEQDDRRVTDDEVKEMRDFVSKGFPQLADAPLVYTRKCLYSDTLDGHFWIDNHPQVKGLSVGTGGSGHGFKMAPILGEIQADVILGSSNPFSKRFRWRELTPDGTKKEDARFIA